MRLTRHGPQPEKGIALAHDPINPPPPQDAEPPCELASPPCYAAEIDPHYLNPPPADIAAWRNATRARLAAARAALSADQRAALALQIAKHLDAHLFRLDLPENPVISGYWPIKSELDLRPWLIGLRQKGWRIALPIVEVRKAPLIFRLWSQDTRLERGVWNIPVPSAESPLIVPDVALAPVLGWDRASYRLGYGGGYFDRTLAQIHPHSIGIGLALAQIDTIHPQSHDIALSAVITENGLVAERL